MGGIQLRGTIGQLPLRLGIGCFASGLPLFEGQLLSLMFLSPCRQLFGLGRMEDLDLETLLVPCLLLVVQKTAGIVQLGHTDLEVGFAGIPLFS